MKKIVFIMALLSSTIINHGQVISKGNVIGSYIMTVELKPNVTPEEFTTFYKNKYIPEFEKVVPEARLFLVKGIRGDFKNSFGLIQIFESTEARSKYINDDGSRTELGKSLIEKVHPLTNELYKLGSIKMDYNDWLVL